mgnify:CR=1 FL=1
MALKENLLKNKKTNEELQYAVATRQSEMSYQLGYNDDAVKQVDYGSMYSPFVHEYAEIKLRLDNGVEENPAAARKYADSIQTSVDIIKLGLENVISNSQIWGEVTQLAGLMGGVDMMGTPSSRYMTLSILSKDLKGSLEIKAVDGDINKLAWYVYDKDGSFVERMFVNKVNELSETQDLFVTIPDTNGENQEFKKVTDTIFEKKQLGSEPENQVLTGGVTETYRQKKSNGELKLKTKDLEGGMVQDFYIIDKDIIKNSMAFNTEIDKITAGLIEAYESSDQVIAFNNNILSEVTDFYLKPASALKPRQEEKFQEDYKEWFLEKEIGNEFPLGEPRHKNQPKEEEEVVEEVDEFAEFKE